MRIRLEKKVEKDLTKLVRKDKKLWEQVNCKLKIFCIDPNRNSLRLHKLIGSMANLWSISINESIRMIFYYEDENTANFVDIGKHEEVYK